MIEFENGIQGIKIPESKEERETAQTLLVEELGRLHRTAYTACLVSVRLFEIANTVSVVAKKLEESYQQSGLLSRKGEGNNEHKTPR